MKATTFLLVTAFTLALCTNAITCLAGNPGQTPDESRANDLLAQNGVRFTENRGQITDTRGNVRNDIRFVAEGAGARLYFTNRGVSYVFAETDQAVAQTEQPENSFAKAAPRETRMHRMDMEFVGANPFPRIRFEDDLPGYANYYLTHCPDGITHVKSYATVVYENVYDNIDLVFISRDERLKYEYRVHPGGHPGDIAMRYSGASRLALLPGGAMEVHSPLGYIEEGKPYTFEATGREVHSSYRLHDDVLSFEVGRYDHDRTLVIDPWGTYYGSGGHDEFLDLGLDQEGNIYVSGKSLSFNYPVMNAIQPVCTGNPDLIIGKFSSAGTLLWTTYYGGSGWEDWATIAVDANGNSVVTGSTASTDLPVKNAIQPAITGNRLEDLCIVALDNAGLCRWATYYGGEGFERLPSVTLDPSGNAFITGGTSDPGIAVTPGAYRTTMASDRDAFMLKLSPQGKRLWATFVGGDDIDWGTAVETDAAGNIVLQMHTPSTNLQTTTGVIQPVHGGAEDFYIAKFTPKGDFVWGTYYGGDMNEWCSPNHLGIDQGGNITIAGVTASDPIPLPSNPVPYQASLTGTSDFFIVQMTPDGQSLNWGTYINATGHTGAIEEYNFGTGLTMDHSGEILFAGSTSNPVIPLLNAHQSFNAGTYNVFLGKMDGISGMPQWMTFYGGSPGEYSPSLGLGTQANGDVLLCGTTYSTNLPVANAYQPYFAGRTDGYLTSFSSTGVGPPLRYATISVTPEQTVPNMDYNTIYLGCASQSLTLTAANTSGSAATNYLWSTSETTQSIVVSPTVSTTYSVTITDANNAVSTAAVRVHVIDVRCGPGLSDVQYCANGVTKCEDEKKVLRTLSRDRDARLGACTALPQNQPPAAAASASPTSGATPLTVDFSSAGSTDPDGSIVSYEWDFGDGNTSALENPQHTYSTSGTYTAQLTVTDNASATASDNVIITVTGGSSSGTVVVASQTVTRVCVQTKADRWEGRDLVVVQDDAGAPIAGAVVNASYSGPNAGTISGSTDGNGEVTFATAAQKSPSTSWCFTVTDVQATGYAFDPANSVMTECESSPKLPVTIPANPSLTVHPNPMSTQARVRFRLPESGNVMLIVYDQLGREVATLAEGIYPAGSHTVRYTAAGNPRGTYFCRLYYGGITATVRLIMR